MTELEVMQHAKMYLDKLARGIDPIADKEVPEDSVLNNVRLARCFFYVSGILGQVIANDGYVGAKPGGQSFRSFPPLRRSWRRFPLRRSLCGSPNSWIGSTQR